MVLGGKGRQGAARRVRSRAHREALVELSIGAVVARLLNRSEDCTDQLVWGEGEGEHEGEGGSEGESEGGGESGREEGEAKVGA